MSCNCGMWMCLDTTLGALMVVICQLGFSYQCTWKIKINLILSTTVGHLFCIHYAWVVAGHLPLFHSLLQSWLLLFPAVCKLLKPGLVMTCLGFVFFLCFIKLLVLKVLAFILPLDPPPSLLLFANGEN